MKKFSLLIILCLLLAFTGTTRIASAAGGGVCWQCSIELGMPVCELSVYGYYNCAINNPIYCNLWPEGPYCIIYPS